MENREYVELRSEDVQEILGTPPGWLVRWGSTVVFLGFGMMLMAAWFVRYPDVVEAKIVLTTSNPPVDVYARADGRIAYYLVKDKDTVQENQLLAILQSTANYKDIKTVDSCAGAWMHQSLELLRQTEPPRDLELGEIQTEYADFIQNYDLYKFGKSSRSATTTSNIGSINLQIKQLEQSIDFDKKAQQRVKDQIAPAEDLYKKQKELVDQGIVSKYDFEKERTKLADLERSYDEYGDNVIRKQNEIIGLRRGITDASFNSEESDAGASTRLHNSLNNLRSAIDKWKQSYLITAPIPGRVAQNVNYYSAKQFVKQGDQLFTLVPPDNSNIVGRMLLPVASSGKVKPKQRVIVKLDSYPYNEYGTIQGIVVSKSLVPKDDQYSIQVGFVIKNSHLNTSFGRDILFEQQLQGKAEIVTEDKGLLERIGDQVFAGMR